MLKLNGFNAVGEFGPYTVYKNTVGGQGIIVDNMTGEQVIVAHWRDPKDWRLFLMTQKIPFVVLTGLSETYHNDVHSAVNHALRDMADGTPILFGVRDATNGKPLASILPTDDGGAVVTFATGEVQHWQQLQRCGAETVGLIDGRITQV